MIMISICGVNTRSHTHNTKTLNDLHENNNIIVIRMRREIRVSRNESPKKEAIRVRKS